MQNTHETEPGHSENEGLPTLPDAEAEATAQNSSPLARSWKAVRDFLTTHAFASPLLSPPWSSPLFGYLVAVVLQAIIATGIALLVQYFPAFHFVGAPLILVVLAVALSWGLGPSILAALVGFLMLLLLILPPYFSPTLAQAENALGALLYLLVGLTVSILASQTQRARALALAAQHLAETERQRLHDLSQRATERTKQLEAVFEAIADPLFIVDVEQDLQKANRAARILFGFPNTVRTDQLRAFGRPFELYDTQDRPLPDELWPQVRILAGEVLHEAEVADIVMRVHDGRTLRLSVTGAPVRTEDGQISGAVLICRDVTERRLLQQHTHEALEALLVMAEELVQFPETGEQTVGSRGVPRRPHPVEERLAELIRTVLHCERVSITSIDPHTGALRSTAVVGLPIELEQQWRAREPGFNLGEQLASPIVDAALKAGEVLVLDLSQPPWSSRPIPYGISVMLLAPMKIDKRLVGVLTLDHGGKDHVYTASERALARAIADLSALVVERERLLEERAEAEANTLAAREATRLMDEFIGIAGHELRTPLTAIKGNVQLAKRQLNRMLGRHSDLLPKEVAATITVVQDHLDRTERQIRMQNRLVSDLLDVARIHANRLELHPDLCDLVTVVRDCVEDQQYLTPMRSITLTIMAPEEVLVMADADRVRQVISNYLSNALKYSEAGKPVEVCMELTGKRARVLVRDEGPGLTEAQQPHVWERFYRALDIEVKSGSGVGLGLGLHISRMIIERQGGQVGVESEPGHGSTFWFTLPCVESEEQ